jgi:hypothetical protein
MCTYHASHITGTSVFGIRKRMDSERMSKGQANLVEDGWTMKRCSTIVVVVISVKITSFVTQMASSEGSAGRDASA